MTQSEILKKNENEKVKIIILNDNDSKGARMVCKLLHLHYDQVKKTSWHRLVSDQFPITFIYIVSHLLAQKLKVKLMC